MAMNNPYLAYQKFATVNSKPININEGKERTKSVPLVSNVAAANMKNGYQNKIADQYLENAVMTATPEELTLMLYDGAIKFMNQAIVYIESNSISKANHALLRAQDIFTELMSTLNREYELSKYLNSLYDYFIRTLVQANIKKDIGLIKRVIDMTKEIRDTWAQAMTTLKKYQKGQI